MSYLHSAGGIAQWLLQGLSGTLASGRTSAFAPMEVSSNPARSLAEQVIGFLGPGRMPLLAQATREALTRWTPVLEPGRQDPDASARCPVLRELLLLAQGVRPPRLAPVLHELVARRHLFAGVDSKNVMIDIVQAACACGAARSAPDGDDIKGFLDGLRENPALWWPEMARVWLRAMVQAGSDLFETTFLIRHDLLALGERGYDIAWYFGLVLADVVAGTPEVARSLARTHDRYAGDDGFVQLLKIVSAPSGPLLLEREGVKVYIKRRLHILDEALAIEIESNVVNFVEQRKRLADKAIPARMAGAYGTMKNGSLSAPDPEARRLRAARGHGMR